jgi:hypothetical protein
MSNRTELFTDLELQHLETIVKDLKLDGKSSMFINGIAHSFFMEHAQDPRKESNLATEAWVMAVVQYLITKGYEVKKKG